MSEYVGAQLRLMMDAERSARTLMETAIEVWLERVKDTLVVIDRHIEQRAQQPRVEDVELP